ncbi:MAG: PfaD family polyunsaturated fatty acid/polyketide biosynthesis protein [Kiritimatiellae bacterium]|nr:PfaD family polyunsaturated fatty acid/polyketide biosynthesis protein [Kiritimatiellia bacterium]
MYVYDSENHALVLVTPGPLAEIKSSYTPFNRKHYQQAKFCLFWVGDLKALDAVYQHDNLYIALLETGYRGQLLIEKKAEFDIGLCPIGGMRFEKIRTAFNVEDSQELIQSFMGGRTESPIPIGRDALEVGRGELGQVEKRSNQVLYRDLAIVGISGRYASAEKIETYWENLKEGKSNLKEWPKNRPGGIEDVGIRGGFLNDVDCFDSLLFAISPAEAKGMDPQERLFLEVVWECLENAGYTGAGLNGCSQRVGVFVGAMWSDYQNQGSDAWSRTQIPDAASFHSSIANRVSYFFNFNGPSASLDTSCSSALTALHVACESIQNGDCDVAVVGGVNIINHPYHQALLRYLDLLSKNNECHPFGAEANGWVVGEGVGAVLIKTKEQAEKAGDTIHGLIKATAISHSGKTMRYGAPNAQSQKESILRVLDKADLSPESIGYVEAAAPGASIADASEMTAIQEVFRDVPSLPVGTVKSNIGHLESASAMSQLTKVLLQVKHGELAPTLNCTPINPMFKLEENGVELVEALKPWDHPRRALINAFGATGSGGHIILEEYVQKRAVKPSRPTLIVLSAATDEQLRRLVGRLQDFMAHSSLPCLSDIGYTLRVGRVEMDERLAVVVETHDELRERLAAYLNGGEKKSGLFRGSVIGETPSPERKEEPTVYTMAEQWVRGVPFDSKRIDQGYERRVPLPTYPFAKEKHWVEMYETVSPTNLNNGKDLQEEHGANGLEKIETKLKEMFAEVSEIPVARIGAKTRLEQYGLNSLMINKLNLRLEKDFGELPKTLFFEYSTLHELAKYFLESHAEQVQELSAIAPKVNVSYTAKEKNKTSYRSVEDDWNDQVAIVGISGRYPKAPNLEVYWENLKNGIDCISEIPPERWDHLKYYHTEKQTPGKAYSKWGGFIDDVDKFDPLFFGISPREAELLDPEERIFLETAWHTCEDAGYTRSSLDSVFNGKVGVFVGVMYGDYQLLEGRHPNGPFSRLVSAAYGSIANRVSYVLDVHGPSMAIDTMCSSSLTALHLASESIRRGECEAAIAGGINLSIHPRKYVQQSQLGMSSTDGRCRSFGEGGDGFVPGEGVGAVLLKPLTKAIKDGDHIYGLIKGIAINHDGKTNGYTVPNPHAQTTMILDALKRAQVDPRTISYLEAHGTGTSLGDPVEIRGLSKAFGTYTEQRQFCPIGSVKSNLGHLEAAAGMVGLTKVLFQMKHQRIVPSLYSKELNPNINFEKSPFYVQQELAEWKRPIVEIDGEHKEYPRIACISSFGAGGSNAHVIIEEYLDDGSRFKVQSSGLETKGPYIIVLSAKNAGRLKEGAKNLQTFLTSNSEPQTLNLHEVAYTLQVGREAMEERLGLVVDSKKELEEQLQAFMEGKEDVEDMYLGRVKRNQDGLVVYAADDDMAKMVEAWAAKGKYNKLLDLWVKGLNVDWNKLYGENKPQRISLPTYPFARERYWIEGNADCGLGIAETGKELHPLVHENTSDVSELRFSSTFTGKEFFFADHPVKGEKILPGTAYLEMVREAVEQACGKLVKDHQSIIHLNNVVWARPISVGTNPQEVHIGLFPEENGEIAYEIYTAYPGEGKSAIRNPQSAIDSVVHSQGVALFASAGQRLQLDLKALQETCAQRVLSTDECYTTFQAMGIEYSPSYQSIEQLYIGENDVLAKLALPSSVTETKDQFTLNPILLDSALQASIGLVFPNRAPSTKNLEPLCPVALERLEIMDSCKESMWVRVRHSEGSSASGQVWKLDIDLCDTSGNVCVKMHGLSCRTLQQDQEYAHAPSSPQLQLTDTQQVPLPVLTNKSSKVVLSPLSEAQPFSIQIKQVRQPEKTLLTEPVSITSTLENQSELTAPVASKISKEVLGKELVVSFAQALYMKQSDIDIDKQFVEMGLDSIVGVEWIQTINKTYSLHIPATKVYDYPSIRELARYMKRELEKQEKGTPLQKAIEQMPERVIAEQKPSKIYPLPMTAPVASKISKEVLGKELVASFAQALYMKQSDIDINKQFVEMGLDSIVGVEWIQTINKTYSLHISATKVYDYPSIRELAGYVQKELEKQEGASSQKAIEQMPERVIAEQKPSKIYPLPMTAPVASKISKEVLGKELVVSFAQALYMKQSDIDIDKQFVEMGLDSIVGVEWIQTINKTYSLHIPATKVYDYPSIRELAGYVQKELEKQERAPLQKTSEHMPERSIAPQKPSKVYALPTLRKQHSIRPLGGPKQAYTHQTQEVNPGHLGSLVFQKRYGCKLSYFTGSMYRGIASEQLVLTMGKENLLSFFGSAGFTAKELEPRIASIQSQLGLNKPYGICLIASLNHPEEEMQQAKLFVQYNIPIIEAAAFSALTPALVYCRVKGLCQTNGRMVFSRRIIAKCSRLEVARLFLAPPPIEMVNDLVGSGLITKEEADLSQRIPMVDDLAVEADSGGHTDQGVSFSLLPSMMALKDSLIREYHYQEEILIGCGGGIGTPESVASAFALGADFIFTGSINQCTVESGAHDIVKDLLSTLSVHDTTTAPAGDMFEMGAKVQVVKKKTQFPNRANRLYQLFQHYKSVEEIPVSIQQDIEKHYFKKTFSEVWDLVCAYKNKKSPEQISEALENARIKLKLIFQWYFARTNQVTFHGDELESDNFQIHSGPAMGAFNQWVKGTSLENWRNRHVDHISEQLMSKACEYIQRKPLFISKSSPQESVSNQEPVSKEVEVSSKAENLSAPKQQRSPQKSDIAIIGMSGQFPRAKNVDEFWENLSQGKDGISEIPATRWSIDQLYDPDKEAPGKTYCKWMGVLEDADQFDPLFFNISPAEAERMDPQQRLFLENAWHCIEDAGLNPASLSGSSCGVFAGCAISDYGQSMNGNALNAQGLMGESPSILTARIAYLLNLKGPCLAIDTACSSSLVAIAEACNSLQLKTSDLALAGGVCVLPGPSMHIMTSKAGMLSEEGRCFTFDKRANGFVPGEGVGIILLKRLSDAIGDGDQIHGVIKGWGVNQDGKTNGITAPSVNSQIALEKEVYDRFGINPEKISLVEAHGTGTKLGDPIEVEALIESFRSYTDKEDYCALGSVKSNIGHLLPAAGVTGAIKLLLALKHRKLPPTIHYNALNEHINLEKSPFYVNTERKEWRRAEGQKRCSAISSFGFSGTNAHVVIEEYLDEKSEILNSKSENKECLIVLSARDEERLQEYVEKFYGYLTSNIEEQRLNIESLAYTLQVGREAMEERLAFIVNSLEELTSRLSSYLEGKKGDFLRGNVKKEKVDIFLEGKAGRAYIETAIGDKESKSLAQLWVKGVEIDWGLLYPDQKPKKVSLPTYPFKKESYWIRGNESAVKPVKTGFTLHPLMHENTSDVSELRFSSTFTGDEFFLTDHVVKGEKLLPGVAYLEMARAAVEEVAGSTQKDQAGIQLKHIVWVQPISVGTDPQVVHIGLFPEENGEIAYEIYTAHPSDEKSAIHNPEFVEDPPGWKIKSIVHSQGVGLFSSVDQPPKLDLKALQEACTQRVLSAEECYESFKREGLDYGPAHQGLEKLYVGDDEVLAKLRVPSSVLETKDQFMLHPSLLDSALQASIGLVFPQREPRTENLEPKLLFGLDSLEIIDRCAESMWVWGRYAEDTSPSDQMRKLDIDLCDEQGKVCVRIKGASIGSKGKEYIELLGENNSNVLEDSYLDKESIDTLTTPYRFLLESEITPDHEQFIKTFIDHYTRKTAHSKSYQDKYTATFADQRKGAVFLQTLRPIAYRILINEAKGSRLKDMDGNTYIDIMGDMGPNLFGHQDNDIMQALSTQLNKGLALSCPYEDLGKTAELFCELTGQDRVMFTQSGTEAVMWGVRVARGFTQRSKIVVFDGAYHGVSDVVFGIKGFSKGDPLPGSLGMPDDFINHIMVLDYDNPESLRIIEKNAKDIAAVLVEPVRSRQPEVQPKDFLLKLRTLTKERNIILLCDEMITGFRVHQQGAQGYFGFQADLATYGKILTGGLTGGALAGRKELMRLIDGGGWLLDSAEWPYKNRVIALGTHTQNPLKMASTYAVLRKIKEGGLDGASTLNHKTSAFAYSMNRWLSEHSIPMEIVHFGSLFRFKFTAAGSSSLFEALFSALLRDRGVMYNVRYNCFFTHAHTDDDIKRVEEIIKTCLHILDKNKFIIPDDKIALHSRPIPAQYDTTIRPQRTERKAIEEKKLIFQEAKLIPDESEHIEERDSLNISSKPVSMKIVKADILDHVIFVFSTITKIEKTKLDIHTRIESYGVDSIMLTELLAKLNNEFSMKVSPGRLIEADTIDKIVDLLSKESAIAVAASSATSHHPSVSVKQTRLGTSGRLAYSRRHRISPGPVPISAQTESSSVDTINTKSADIAIIGISGRFPQSNTVDELFTHLMNNDDLIQEIPKFRWDWEEWYGDPEKEECFKTLSKWGGFLDDISGFDPLFFGISPKEAAYFDPQQRLFLEESWKACEDAGYRPSDLAGQNIGVFAGYEFTDYDSIIKDAIKNGSNIPEMLATNASFLPGCVSYHLNLKGPSEAINGSCASGLLSVHRAASAIHAEECTMALAGAVEVMLSPYTHVSQATLHSEDSHCRVFDNQASGYVRGEGVVVVLLKSLTSAIRDGDRILGVIKSSVHVNRGKAISPIAFSPDTMRKVVKDAYLKSGVPLNTINYIELEGVSEKWSDAMEAESLKDVFTEIAEMEGYDLSSFACGLGSLKGNIGNLEPVSGLASLAKVLQAMQHKQIPATLHHNALNEFINFENTPFYMVTQNEDWNPVETSAGTAPLRAGISSFAASGAHVHMVVEGYSSTQNQEVEKLPYYLLPLSAKTPEALHEKIEDMIEALPREEVIKEEWAALSYTLQKGRDHFACRCAIVVEKREDAVYGWEAFKKGETHRAVFAGRVPGGFQGQQAIEEMVKDLLSQSRTLQKAPEKYREKLYALAEFYCKGYEIVWDLLYGGYPLKKVGLPTYPFTREYYWIEQTEVRGLPRQRHGQKSEVSKRLHPLVHENTSTLEDQRFSSTFTGEEFFLKDHQVNGKKVVPGVAYLEMAREAAEQATGELSEDKKNNQKIELKNVVWAHPITVGDQPQEVHIGLFPEESGEIAYEIYTAHPSDEKSAIRNLKSVADPLGWKIHPIVHSQGVVLFASADQRLQLDLKALQESCNQSCLSAEECYAAFKAMGIDYGPAYQGIENIYVGEDEVLAELTLPFAILETKDQFTLYPSLLDSALQASIGLDFTPQQSSSADLSTDLSSVARRAKGEALAEEEAMEDKPITNPVLRSSWSEGGNQQPFLASLERLEIIHSCKKSMWAWVRYSESNEATTHVKRLDIDLCDDQGKVCVQMLGVSLQEWSLESAPVIKTEVEAVALETQSVFEFSLAKDHDINSPNHLKFSPDEKAKLFIQQLLASQLKVSIDAVNMEKTFMEVGLISSDLMIITQSIRKIIAPDFSPSLLFEYTTPVSLSTYLSQTYQSAYQQLVVISKDIQVSKTPQASSTTQVQAMPTAMDYSLRALALYKKKNGAWASKYRLGANTGSGIQAATSSQYLVDDYVLSTMPIPNSDTTHDFHLDQVEALLLEVIESQFSVWVENQCLHMRSYRKELPHGLRQKIEVNAKALSTYVADKKYMPLSSAQKGYWTLSLMQADKASYNCPLAIRFRGKMDRDILEKSFVDIINRNQQFRALFPMIQKKVVQCVSSCIKGIDELSIKRVDLSHYDAGDQEKEVHRLMVKEAQNPINPKTGPILRMQQVTFGAEDFVVMLSFHHTGIDGYSIKPLLDMWEGLYLDYANDKTPIEPKGYVDYEWHVLKGMAGVDLTQAYPYWIKTLKGAPAYLKLPTDFPRPIVNRYCGDTQKLMISQNDLSAFKQALAPHNITQYVGLLSILKLVLYKWTGQKDIVIGTTSQLRDADLQLYDMIGDFTNFIPIRSQIRPTMSCLEFFKAETSCVYEGLNHKELPFVDMIELAPETFPNINPIYNVLALQQDTVKEDTLWAESVALEISDLRALNKSAMLDLGVEWGETPAGLWILIEYNTDLFKQETISQILDSIKKCVANLDLNLCISDYLSFIYQFDNKEQKRSSLGKKEVVPILNERVFVKEIFERNSSFFNGHHKLDRLSLDRSSEEVVQEVLHESTHVLNEDRAKTILNDIHTSCAEILAVSPEDIDPKTSFFDLGFQSVNVIQLASLLDNKYGDVSATELFQYPNANQLANYLISR